MSRKTASTATLADHELAPESFESAMAELETLVRAMDNPGTGLDQLLKDYKRGAFLVKYCRNRLTQVKQEVSEIESELLNDDDGEQA